MTRDEILNFTSWLVDTYKKLINPFGVASLVPHCGGMYTDKVRATKKNETVWVQRSY